MGLFARLSTRKSVAAAPREELDLDLHFANLKEKKKLFLVKWENKNVENGLKLTDFKLIVTLGTGSFGRVMLVQNKASSLHFALKILKKATIVKLKQVEHTIYEKNILEAIEHPFIINLHHSFKDNAFCYMVQEFVPGGELFTHLRSIGRFPEADSRFYGGQILNALEYLHYCEVVYRDLKPENVLIDRKGYVKITDFGFAKKFQGRTWTLCGTPEYLAPEIILSKGYNKAVDYWSLGVLIFEMTAGFPPFIADQPIKIYEKIVTGKINFPGHFSADLKSMLKELMQVDVGLRLGNLRLGAVDIMNQKWFQKLDFTALLDGSITPTYVPKLKSDIDTSNFDKYDEEDIKVTEKMKYAKEFSDF